MSKVAILDEKGNVNIKRIYRLCLKTTKVPINYQTLPKKIGKIHYNHTLPTAISIGIFGINIIQKYNMGFMMLTLYGHY